MLSFVRKFCKSNKSNKSIKYPFNQNYRNGYKKLWIDSLRYDSP
jgi:hypothetical protein